MPAPRKIGFAVVGLGLISRNAVLPAFAHSKKSRLVSLVSRDAKKAAQWRKKFKAAHSYSVQNYDACLNNPEVSAVYIATPPGEHEALATRAAAAGKHVLCEKPLAATVDQSARMVEACRKHSVLLMTAYRKYFEPASLYLKSLIRKGSLGRIDTIHASFSERFVPDVSLAWLLDPLLAGGGPLMDLGVYCVNTSRWLVDEDPLEASAESWRHDKKLFANVEEGISFRLNFRSGLRILATTTYSAAMSSFVFVQGSKGFASLIPAFPFEVERIVSGKISNKNFMRRFRPLDEFALELDAFADAIQNKKSVEPDGAQGLRDLQIIQAIYESANSGRSVAIKY
jgi:predicted dehydrogenase